MAFAILRIGKISSAVKATAADAHNQRSYEVKNADAEKKHLNGEYINTGQRPTWELASERIEAVGIKPKADAVRVVEFLLAASPEFFTPGEDIRESAYFQANLQFMQERYGKNLLAFTLHQDETSPHFQCMVVPITTEARTVKLKNGQEHTRTGYRLTAAELFTKATLRQLQTDYAQAMAPFGLARGAEKSPTKHQAIKRVYGLNRQVHELDEIVRQGEEIKSEVVELSQQKETLTEENQQLSQVVAQQRQQIAHLVAQKDDQQRKAESLTTDLKTLSGQKRALESQLTQLVEDKTRLTTVVGQQHQQIDQLAAQSNDLLKKAESLTSTISTLKSQKMALDGMVTRLSQNKNKLTSDVKTLTVDNDKLIKENEAQRQNLDYIQKKANALRKDLGQEQKPVQKPEKLNLNTPTPRL